MRSSEERHAGRFLLALGETGTGGGDAGRRNIFRYVLAHECGHYVGLCHYGHDGFQNIMFTPAPEAHLSYADWGLVRYL